MSQATVPAPVPQRNSCGCVVRITNAAGDTTRYTLKPAGSRDGLAFRLDAGNGRTHTVTLDWLGRTGCTCEAATYHPGDECKHVKALAALGLLPVVLAETLGDAITELEAWKRDAAELQEELAAAKAAAAAAPKPAKAETSKAAKKLRARKPAEAKKAS